MIKLPEKIINIIIFSIPVRKIQNQSIDVRALLIRGGGGRYMIKKLPDKKKRDENHELETLKRSDVR